MLKRFLLLFAFLLFLYVAHAFLNPIPKRHFERGFRPSYGVSYSFEQALWYGLDPRKSYVDLLRDFEFDWVRLPFFWDQMAPLRSQASQRQAQQSYEFNERFDDLRFAIEEAKKRDVEVIIALGAKTPYFPEYHWPHNIAQQVKFGEKISIDHPVADQILAIDRKVVETLAQYDNIIFWQVENEPLIGNVNRLKIDLSLIAAEVAVVRSTDPKKRPVILNHAATGFWDNSWKELLSILKPGDVFSVNAFFKTKGKDIFNAEIFDREIHIAWPNHLVWPVHSWFPLSPNFESIKKEVEANGNSLWILEMQAEPYLNVIEQADDPLLSYKAEDIAKAEHFLRSHKIEAVGFWGAHFWQYREKKGDDGWIRTVGKIVNRD